MNASLARTLTLTLTLRRSAVLLVSWLPGAGQAGGQPVCDNAGRGEGGKGVSKGRHARMSVRGL